MEGSPRKIQFMVPLLDSHLDPEAAEQIRRRRPTPATLVASSDQSSPDEDRLPHQLYKQALLNSPRQKRRGVKGAPTMKELQFLVEHHVYQQCSASGADESSESCVSDVGRDKDTAEHDGSLNSTDMASVCGEFEKLCCQMEAFSRESLSDAAQIEPVIHRTNLTLRHQHSTCTQQKQIRRRK